MFLLTNDDGIHAQGLAALWEGVGAERPKIVAAPREEQSGWSHRVTDTKPIEVTPVSSDRFAITGTPVDCVRLGVLHLAEGVEWVLSGINSGGNLGSDVYMSGTVAAAREASLLGLPAIAVSQYRRSLRGPIDWRRSRQWTQAVLKHLLNLPLNRGEFWNVNLPDPEDPAADPKMVFCPLDPGHHAVCFRQTAEGYLYCGNYQQRHREPGCDVDVCFSGDIAVTRLSGAGQLQSDQRR